MGLLLNATQPMLAVGTTAVINKPFHTKLLTGDLSYMPKGTVVTIMGANPLLRTYDIKQQNKETCYTVNESYVQKLRVE